MKVAILFCLIFSSGQASSCQYDLRHLDYLNTNPERASLAAIVKVVRVISLSVEILFKFPLSTAVITVRPNPHVSAA